MSSIYKPLEKTEKQIRLLRVIKPAIKEDTLCCETKVLSLLPDNVDQYTAISYCWGAPEPTRPLTVDGKRLNVPRNTEAVIRSAVDAEPNSLFWVDAVCIDQQNNRERSHQVGMMRDVYSKASHVFVWQGHEDTRTVAAIRSIEAIVTQCREETQNLSRLNETIWYDKNYTYSDAGLPFACDWDALYGFFASPWFTRMWPIQEVCLAREARYYFGHRTIPWDRIALAARWMYHRKYWVAGKQRCRGIDCAAEVFDSSGQARGLCEHLQLCPYFDATDPRDLIFGLLGLIPDSSPGAEGQSLAIVPDYEAMSLKDVYEAATRVSIAEGSFTVLKRAAYLVPPANHSYPDTLRIDPFPSWVPRFDGSWDPKRGSHSAIVATKKPASQPVESGPAQPSDRSGVLRIPGVKVAMVVEVGVPLTFAVLQDPSATAKAMRCAWVMAKRKAPAKVHLKDTLSTFISTICAGRNGYYQVIGRDPTHEQEFATFMLNHGGLGSETDKILRGAITGKPVHGFLESLIETSMNRCYLIGNSGEQALGPLEAQAGDSIVILFGADVPFILRPSNGCWLSLGDAYVYGIMEGEFIQKLETQGILDKSRVEFLLA